MLTWPLGHRLYTWGVPGDLLTVAAVGGAACGALAGLGVVLVLRRSGV